MNQLGDFELSVEELLEVAAYLHPIRKAHRVGHILRASANAVRVTELRQDDEGGREALRREVGRAVLSRYPRAVPLCSWSSWTTGCAVMSGSDVSAVRE